MVIEFYFYFCKLKHFVIFNMKRNFTFLGKIAIAILLVFGMTVSGCKKEPLPGDGSEVVKPGDGDEDGDGKEEEKPGEQGTVTVRASGVALTSVVFIGTVSADIIADGDYDFGVSYSTSNRPDETKDETILKTIVRRSIVDDVALDGSFEIPIGELKANTKYYYCSYILKGGQYSFGEIASFETADVYSAQADIDLSKATDLSADGAANCYIVTDAAHASNSDHAFKFLAVKGNDKTQTLQGVAKAEILWESTGSSSIPERCSIVAGVCAKDGYVAFRLPDTYKEGNAVIAAKDAEGTILWSWHIWLTDQPGEDVYPNNAGTMMDRNLGATSVQGDNNCGLLYQWGRKDPFLGYSTASDKSKIAASTVKWPSAVKTTEVIGTNEWAVKNPMTFITSDCREPQKIGYDEQWQVDIWGPRLGNYDWYYNKAMYDQNLTKEKAQQYIIGTDRWKRDEKTIYDPCPYGWKVPEGGSNSVWNQAGITEEKIQVENGGARIVVGSISIWYPASGYLESGQQIGIGDVGYYWASNSVAADGMSSRVCKFNFKFSEMALHPGSKAAFNAVGDYYPEAAMAVRCVKIQ